MIDIQESREAYNDEIIDDLLWIRLIFNFYRHEKTCINEELLNMLQDCIITYEVENTIIKTKKRNKTEEKREV